MKSILPLLLVVTAIVSGYISYRYLTPEPVREQDESSFSNIYEVETQTYFLNLTVDFTKKQLIGSNTLTLKSLKNNLKKVILDAHNLEIHRIIGPGNHKLKFKQMKPSQQQQDLGGYVKIRLKRAVKKDEIFNITIEYSTTEDQTAVSWLEPEQTAGGKHPYLYTQCEPIYCRQIAPLQDSPSIKSTYTALIKTPKGLKAFLSANETKYTEDELHRYTYFESLIPIPSYLFAMVVGNLEQRSVGKRTEVITEGEQIDEVQRELENLEDMLTVVENYIRYPYIWGYYKIVVLPPSFPVGGMENPLLTFASPSIIVGDKSQVAVAIHEIAHSWTGNLVTNKNWKNFWVNEGFTRFLERKGAERFIGSDYIPLDEIVSYPEFLAALQQFGNTSFSSIRPVFNGRNPDDAFSTIPYEKGYFFLKYIESQIGAEHFRGILSNWINKHAYSSVDTQDFKQHLLREFWQRLGIKGLYIYFTKINWNKWINQPGEPPIKQLATSPLVAEGKQLAQDYILRGGDSSPDNYQKFRKFYSKVQSITLDEFILNSKKINQKIVQRLENDFRDLLTNVKQCELIVRFLRLCILTGYTDNDPLIIEYMGSIGRMRYITPIFVQLIESGRKDFAIQVYNLHKPFYHPIARRAFESILFK